MEGHLILFRFFGYFHTFLTSIQVLYLSQIVCMINVYILKCQHAKCDCCLWKVLWFNCIFWVLFIYYYMFETAKLHKTFTNCMLRQKFRNEKQPFVSIYGYVSLVLIYETLCLGRAQNIDLYLKIISKKLTEFEFGST